MPSDGDDRNAPILNALPALVWVYLLAIAAVEAVLSAGHAGLIGGAQAVGWRVSAFQDFAFSSALQAWMWETGQAPIRVLMRYLTYPFIHANPTHAVFAVVLIAALGKAVAEGMGTRALGVLLVAVPAAAAAVFALAVGRDDLGWLFGAMVPAFALVGAFTWLKWDQAAGDPVKQRRAFSMIAVLVVARLAFGLLAEIGLGWIAELFAFAAGFVLAWTVLGPGRWQALRARMRQRG